MDFSTGNSGNSLFHTVTKVGPECQQEGVFCQHLGERVTPKIYAIIPNGYVMEALKPASRGSWLLRDIERLLMEEVWPRPALPSTSEVDWRDKLNGFGVSVPDWAIPTEFCLTHGDPTASNALFRGDRTLVLGDPRPPRDYIPQCREADMVRIYQSFLGWEVAAYGATQTKFLSPLFIKDRILEKKARFWAGAAAARIQFLELSRANREHILRWCESTRRICNV